jgi:hypothetical protein
MVTIARSTVVVRMLLSSVVFAMDLRDLIQINEIKNEYPEDQK